MKQKGARDWDNPNPKSLTPNRLGSCSVCVSYRCGYAVQPFVQSSDGAGGTAPM